MAAGTIRFTDLVEKSGRPDVVALWTDPKKNREFQKALRENRVLTVKQEPAGTKKDYGRIGFFQERGVSYLVFPKSLPRSDARVVGLKYELLR